MYVYILLSIIYKLIHSNSTADLLYTMNQGRRNGFNIYLLII